MAECIFCNIVQGRTTHSKVWEDAHFYAFLDIKPLFLGHTLLVPKQHVETLYTLPADAAQVLLLRVQQLGEAVQKAMQAQGTFIAINNVVSQSVPHMHIHIVPRNKGDGLKGFFWPRMRYKGKMEMQATQKTIQKYLGT